MNTSRMMTGYEHNVTTTFHQEQHNEHGFTCGQCMKEGTLYTSVSCTICGTYRGKDSWTTVNTTDNDTVAICNNCYKPWLKDYEGVVPTDILQQQRDKLKKKIIHFSFYLVFLHIIIHCAVRLCSEYVYVPARLYNNEHNDNRDTEYNRAGTGS